jgi:hypothetical protein
MTFLVRQNEFLVRQKDRAFIYLRYIGKRNRFFLHISINYLGHIINKYLEYFMNEKINIFFQEPNNGIFFLFNT